MATTAKAKIRQHVYLNYPKNLLQEPLLSLLAKRFKVIFNIRSSTVTSEMGLVAIEIEGRDGEVTKAIAWLKSQGVAVEALEKYPIE